MILAALLSLAFMLSLYWLIFLPFSGWLYGAVMLMLALLIWVELRRVPAVPERERPERAEEIDLGEAWHEYCSRRDEVDEAAELERVA